MINDKNEAIGRSENVCFTADFGHTPLRGGPSEFSLENEVLKPFFLAGIFGYPCEISAAVAGLRNLALFRGLPLPLLFVCFCFEFVWGQWTPCNNGPVIRAHMFFHQPTGSVGILTSIRPILGHRDERGAIMLPLCPAAHGAWQVTAMTSTASTASSNSSPSLRFLLRVAWVRRRPIRLPTRTPSHPGSLSVIHVRSTQQQGPTKGWATRSITVS
jgi:hypothetical protein